MAVSLASCEIYSVKEWLHLEKWVTVSHLWNQLPVSFRQSSNHSLSHSPHFTHCNSYKSSSILPSL